MSGKSTVFQRLRMNQGLGFNETERLRMRNSIIRSLYNVFFEARRQCGMHEPTHIRKVCPQDSGPICCRTEKFCADTTSTSSRCDLFLQMGETPRSIQIPSSKTLTRQCVKGKSR